MNLEESIQLRIQDHSAQFGVIGLGYVGLPLSVEFALRGFTTLGFDVNQLLVDDLNSGRVHIADVDTDVFRQLVEEGRFSSTADMERLADCDIISICVPTPLSKTRDPDIAFVAAATESVAKVLRPGQLIILESTTYPGTTREVILPMLEGTGLKAGQDFFLAFSPERVDPGNSDFGIVNTPKVVGGIDNLSTTLATQFYGAAIERIVPVSSPEAAEMVKLLENTFRAVNIGLANESAIMADRLGIDIWEVIDAASTKPFGFMPFYPGPGIGGHCIPLDPFYLSWKMKTLNYRARFIELAGEINSEMPEFVVDKVTKALNEQEKSVKSSHILVLGVAYKPDVNDSRESPAIDIIQLLQMRGAKVNFNDPHVASLRVGTGMINSVALTDEAFTSADCVVIATNHSAYDYDEIYEKCRSIIDTRNAFRDHPDPLCKIDSL